MRTTRLYLKRVLTALSLIASSVQAEPIPIINHGFEDVSRPLAPGTQTNGIGDNGILVGTRSPYPFGNGVVDWSDPLTVSGWRTRTVPFGSDDGVLAGVLRPDYVDGVPFVTGIEGTNALAIQASLVGQKTSTLLQPDTTYTLSFLGAISQFDSEYFFAVSLVAIDDSAVLPFEGQPGVTRLALGTFFPPSNVPDGVMRRYEFSYTTPEVLPPHFVGTRVGISVFGSDGLPRVVFDDFKLNAVSVPNDCPADVNNDGMLTPTDFTAWVGAFNNNAPECDQNGDGACTPTDFTAWIGNYNAGC